MSILSMLIVYFDRAFPRLYLGSVCIFVDFLTLTFISF